MDEYSTGISMKESHTHCVCCGRNISTALAKRYAGGCSKCYEEKTSSVEPKNFKTLLQELKDRIRALDAPPESLMSYCPFACSLSTDIGFVAEEAIESQDAGSEWHRLISSFFLVMAVAKTGDNVIAK